jgi:hypothetical protein
MQNSRLVVNAVVLLGACCETAKTGDVSVFKQVVLHTVQSFTLLLISAVCIV